MEIKITISDGTGGHQVAVSGAEPILGAQPSSIEATAVGATVAVAGINAGAAPTNFSATDLQGVGSASADGAVPTGSRQGSDISAGSAPTF